jgi:cell division protein FtsI/penicillin-binding protein 2
VKKNIEALRIKGIGFESQEARYYPEGSSAAQILGFVGKDENGGDIGYFGLEGYYNLPLSGKSGFLGREKDARGAPILVNGVNQVSAVSGVNLKTNVDKRAQLLVEEKLKEGIDKYGASGGHVTIMDPTSGRVMAMAGYPSFDPQEYVKYGDSLFKNPVISDTFEPGSIFKVLVMAAGLDAGVIEPDTKCDICAGPLKIDKYFIKTWNDEYHPDISMTDVIVHSDNVGMTFIGRKLGAEAMFDYLDKFGIGKTSGIDLQGESAVALRKKGTWNDVDLATASFGQGVAVNGIQMVRAVAAVANGGYLVTPRVVNSVQGDAWEEEIKSDPPKRIISRQAAEETAQMMVQASDKGEAKWANVSGFSIAGKTGTAQIPVSGHYDSTNTNVSFIGFAPAVNPKFVMLVTLKSPQSSPWAAETAAPLWYSIAKELFPYLGVSPSQ